MTTTRYAGLTQLSAFNPDDEDHLSAAVVELRSALERADQVTSWARTVDRRTVRQLQEPAGLDRRWR